MRTCLWECPRADVVPLCLAFWMGMSRHKVTSWLRALGDANWGGNRDSRSTSSAQHIVNGQLVHSSSRNQHCIALSSTESEYYSLVSCAIDTLYLKHILEFMFPSKNVVATVYVDNSACRQIANKLGTGRLRHIQGKLLWIQHIPSLGKSRSKLLGPLGTQQTLAPKLFQLTDTECFATCWTCSWVVTGWENNNITEQPKPTGTNRPLKKFAMFHFPILLWPRTCSTTLWRELFNLFAWATSVWRKESCVQHATRLVSQQALSQPPVHEYDLCLYGKMFMVLMILAGMILYVVMWKIERGHGYTGCHKDSAL